MKKISLQWRITLMTAILIGITCVSMNSLIGYSGRHYMDSIGSDISANSDSYKGEQEFFNPESADLDRCAGVVFHYKLVHNSGCNIAWRCFGILCQWQSIEAFAHLCFKG